MGRRKAKTKFDFNKEAIKFIELLAGRELPKEEWKQKYFIMEARDRFVEFEDRVELLEGEVDELKNALSMVKEKADDLLEQTKESSEEIANLVKGVLEDG